jgi:tRNA A37 threonylcarbamoyladenosine dehydratase
MKDGHHRPSQQAYSARFSGIQRLYGKQGQGRLRKAHVCVVGIGGVGSWTVEALARSGVGVLTLIDLDEICISNTNRQLHAVRGVSGQAKVDVMARRVLEINPDCTAHAVQAFFTASTADTLLATRFDCLVDAIDQVTQKSLLIAQCHERHLPIVTTGGAGGRRDPTRIRTTDLAHSTHDALLQEVRRLLRREYGFPRPPSSFGVDAVFSTERQVFPTADGEVYTQRQTGQDLRLDCNSGYGTASFLTGAFGFAAAALAVNRITCHSPADPP